MPRSVTASGAPTRRRPRPGVAVGALGVLVVLAAAAGVVAVTAGAGGGGAGRDGTQAAGAPEAAGAAGSAEADEAAGVDEAQVSQDRPGSACPAVREEVRAAADRSADEVVAPGWTLVWSDEFDGAAVDPERWNVRDQDSNANEASYLLRRNVELCDGYLALTARREEAGGRAFTSGYLDTIGTASFEVGHRVELRAMVPTDDGTSQGMWPAFWLRSDQHGGEIDVAEFYGSPHPPTTGPSLSVHHVVHEDTHGGLGRSGATYLLPDGARPGEGFHTYAAEVVEDGVRFEVDGVTSFVADPAEHPWLVDMLTGTWNIRLNLQVGRDGSWATAPTGATVLPASFVVDHVRVYRRS